MSSLQQQSITAKRALEEVAGELNLAQRAIRKRESRDKAQLRIIKRFCMVLFILSAGDPRLLQCAWQHQTNKHPSLECDRYTALTVTELIAEQLANNNLTPAEQHFLHDADQPEETKTWTNAFYFFVEWTLAMQIGELILLKHVAAHCSYVHAHRRQLLLHSACDIPPQVLICIQTRCDVETECAARKVRKMARNMGFSIWIFKTTCFGFGRRFTTQGTNFNSNKPKQRHTNDTNNSFKSAK